MPTWFPIVFPWYMHTFGCNYSALTRLKEKVTLSILFPVFPVKLGNQGKSKNAELKFLRSTSPENTNVSILSSYENFLGGGHCLFFFTIPAAIQGNFSIIGMT